MAFSIKLLWGLLALGLILGGVALSMWGIPAPTSEVRVTIPVEKLRGK